MTNLSPITRNRILAVAAVVTLVPVLYLIGEYSEPPPVSDPLPDAKPVPQMQVLPLPYDQASITRDGVELTRYHFGASLRRPFLYPIIGPSRRSLTRMGHPGDPVGHSHHNSVWISHHNVNGEQFWPDRGTGRIVHRRIVKYVDEADHASIVAVNDWVGKDDVIHLHERRGMTVTPLPNGEWMLILDVQFEAPKGKPAVIGQTPFGMIGVRMAKTIGVHDGGGLIRNSEGNVNEKGDNGVFRKPAKWCDYSGPITQKEIEGITLFDHPSNPSHPTPFHVRVDGWMGACLTHVKPITIEPGKLLRLRYGLYVHRGIPSKEALDKRWAEYAKSKIEDLPTKRN